MKHLLAGIIFLATSLGNCGAYGEEAMLHSFADWSLPPCRACDRTLIERTIAATYGEHGWPTVEGRSGGSSTFAPNTGHFISSEIRTIAWQKQGAASAQKPEDQKKPENPKQPEDQKKKEKQYSPSATAGSPGHIFWVIPAFKVDYVKGFQPLSPKEKFQQWAQGEYDPLGLGAGALEAATLEHSATDGFCGYGHGLRGYGECFGSLELDATNSSFIGDFVLPVLLHQDPRYFRLGEGSFGRRVWYAVSRVFVTYNDQGHTVIYSSALTGTAIAAGLSNLYYPSQDVGVSHTMTRIAIDLGNTALYNAAAEFWPDIHRKLKQIF